MFLTNNSSFDDCLTVRFTHYYTLDKGKLNTQKTNIIVKLGP